MTKREPVLIVDLLRFVAALAVVGYHLATVQRLLGAPIRDFDPQASLPAAGVAWTWFGWVGVEVFFVISGFVIAGSATAAASPADFLRRRMLRLAPAAWICASITALVLLSGGAQRPLEIAGRWSSTMLFLPSSELIDGSYWTLKVELVFYLAAAWAIGRWGGAAMRRLAFGLGAASGAFWLFATMTGWPVHDCPQTFLLNQTLLPHGVFFALGMVLARAATASWSRDGAIGAAALVVAGLFEIREHAGVLSDMPGYHPVAVPMAVFVVAVVAIAAASRLQPALRRWPGPMRLGTLGRATYPLYLLHQVVGAALIAALLRRGAPAPFAIAAAAALVVLAAFAISRWAEPALRAALADYLIRRRAPDADNPPTASLPAG